MTGVVPKLSPHSALRTPHSALRTPHSARSRGLLCGRSRGHEARFPTPERRFPARRIGRQHVRHRQLVVCGGSLRHYGTQEGTCGAKLGVCGSQLTVCGGREGVCGAELAICAGQLGVCASWKGICTCGRLLRYSRRHLVNRLRRIVWFGRCQADGRTGQVCLHTPKAYRISRLTGCRKPINSRCTSKVTDLCRLPPSPWPSPAGRGEHSAAVPDSETPLSPPPLSAILPRPAGEGRGEGENMDHLPAPNHLTPSV